MDWQLVVVFAVALGAAAYLGRRARMSLRARKQGCGDSCACGKAPEAATPHVTLVPADQILVRRRR